MRIAIVLFVCFLAIQFIRPEIGNPPVTAVWKAPDKVIRIFRTSCYNCHSNETRLSWFDQIAPAYWLVARDVRAGRQHLNFSESAPQTATLYEAINQIRLGAMPLANYKRVHPDSVITPEQLAVLEVFVHPAGETAASSAAQNAAADEQFDKWIHSGQPPSSVAAAPNGMAFPAGYRDWKTISSTERFDNHTMRLVLGNDVAIRAIAAHQTNPWPDGAAFAKVAWDERVDDRGEMRPGVFKQVEFMVKGREKYAGTLGWNWGRWLGAGLKPYGKNASFAAECVGCHTPLRKTDFVFTMPVRSFPGNPFEWRVITSAIDQRGSTMSTLYGNDAAVDYARRNSQQDYPSGSALTLVTWTGQNDEHWFGAKVPESVKSVESVFVEAAADHQRSYRYERYEGAPLKRVNAEVTPTPQGRTSYVLSQKASVLP